MIDTVLVVLNAGTAGLLIHHYVDNRRPLYLMLAMVLLVLAVLFAMFVVADHLRFVLEAPEPTVVT